MGNNKVTATLLCLPHGLFRDVEREKCSATRICRIACLQSCVVVALLQSARGKFLNRVNYTANRHCFVYGRKGNNFSAIYPKKSSFMRPNTHK